MEKRMSNKAVGQVVLQDNSQPNPVQGDSNSKSTILTGQVLRTTVKIGVPILISFIFMFLYNMVNTLFLANIDRNSTAIISGVSLVVPIYNFFIALSTGLRVGISSLTARSIGENNHQKLASSFNSGLFIAIIVTVITLTVFYWRHEQIILFFAGERLQPEAIQAGIDYLLYLLPGLGLLLLGQPFIGFLWGKGLTAPFGIAMIISNIFNVILDAVFIFKLNMGPAGAALATSISMVVAGLYLVPYFLIRKISVSVWPKMKQIKKKIIVEICNIGFSQVFSMFSLSVAFMVLNRLISSIGQTEMNSWGLCYRLDSFVLMPVYAISGATLVMLGQNLGNRNWDQLKKIYHSHIIFASICVFGLAMIYIFCAPYLFKLFSDVEAVIRGSVLQVRIVTLSFLGLALETISTSTFQGIGKPFAAFWLAAIRMFGFAIPLSYFTVYQLSLGMMGVFISIFIAHIGVAVIAYLWVNHEFKHTMLQMAKI
jgi:putative MATE family efflux protein